MARPARALRRHVAPAGALAATTAVAALVNLEPVLDRWSTAVPSRIDNRFQAWVLHWVQGAAMGEHALFDAATFAPASGSLTFSDHLIGLAVALLPLRWAGLSPAAVFNTAVVLGLVATALSGYVLGHVVTRRRGAAVVAGAVGALGPLPWLATMHLNLVWRPGLALAVALVWVVADRAGGRHRWLALPSDRVLLAGLAAVVAWQGLVSFFYAVFVLLVVVVAAVVRWRDLRGGGDRWARPGRVALATAVGAAGCAWSYLPYLATRRRQDGFGWELEDIASLRAAPHIVEEANLAWGGLLGRPLWTADGFHAFPGLVVLALVAAGAVLARAWSRREGSGAAPLLAAALVVVGGLGALGPGWGRTLGWTPYALAFRFVPGFSAIRASGRFVLVVLLGVSVLAAVAVAEGQARLAARARSPRRARAAGVAVVAVVVAGLAVEGANRGRDAVEAVPRPIDRVLADLREDGGVVYLPIGFDSLGDVDAQEAVVVRAAAHDRPIANGFAGFYPRSARVLAERLRDLPGDGALDCLAAHGIRFVVVTDRAGGGPWGALADPAAAAPLEPVATAGGERLYRAPDRPVGEGTCPLPGVDGG